jgi:hypothetical protein
MLTRFAALREASLKMQIPLGDTFWIIRSFSRLASTLP